MQTHFKNTFFPECTPPDINGAACVVEPSTVPDLGVCAQSASYTALAIAYVRANRHFYQLKHDRRASFASQCAAGRELGEFRQQIQALRNDNV